MSFSGIRCLVVLSVIASTAGAQGRALTIEDYYRVKTVSAPQISPDGKWVIFNVITRTEPTNQDSVHSWLASSDGSVAPRNLNRPNAFIGGLQWADDGRLVFSDMGRRW